MYNRPINYELQWCVSGVSYAPSQEKIRYGWSGAEKPMVEHLNWMMNRIDGAIGYFLQGISRWGSEVDYSVNDMINFNGSLFICIEAHRNQPTTNKTYWKEAFFSTANGESLAEEIRKMKEEDGYLSKYLKISNPITPNRMNAGSYGAKVGLPSTSAFNVGYSFENNTTTGLFLSGTTINFRVAGNTRASVPNAVPQLDDATTAIATTDWVQRLIESKIGNIDLTANRLPVGTVYISIGEQNPNATLGYGTWVRFSEGRVLVGRSTIESDAEWKKTVLNTFGEDSHQLTIDELPNHNHNNDRFNRLLTVDGRYTSKNTDSTPDEPNLNASGNKQIVSVGNDQPHNNVQPSIVVNIWRRTA